MKIDNETAQIKLSVPLHIDFGKIESFIKKNLTWIEENQQKILVKIQKRTNLKNLEQIIFFGKYIDLDLKEGNRFGYKFYNEFIEITVRDFSDKEIERCINLFYKKELSSFIDKILPHWEQQLIEKVANINYRVMKTKFGSCKPSERKITLNIRLARFPENCIEMVLIHEMVHFKEFYHNAKFKNLMSKYCPNWRSLEKQMKNF